MDQNKMGSECLKCKALLGRCEMTIITSMECLEDDMKSMPPFHHPSTNSQYSCEFPLFQKIIPPHGNHNGNE